MGSFNRRHAMPILLLLGVPRCSAQMQFEIPAEMLQGMFGGGGGGRQQLKETTWPTSVSSEIAPEFEWLINTEWAGKTAKYLLLRDGFVESDLKECEPEGQCLWAANNGHLMLNTPRLKVLKFSVNGLDKADKKKLDDKDVDELRKLSLTSEAAAKTGKRSHLAFSKLQAADEDENLIGRDLFEVLDVPEDADASTIKSKFRRASVQNHPDKGGDPKIFAELRDAYEILSDPSQRKYYELGGVGLVKNMELAFKEAEGQAGMLDAKLAGIPKNHPQYAMAKQQIEQEKQKLSRANIKSELENKFKSEDTEMLVPVPVQELYNGVNDKEFTFKRLIICRGCRADPTIEKCKDCGRCPPEKMQVPKYGMTPFGRQVVGMREKEQESRERCREEMVTSPKFNVKPSAEDGATLRYISNVGDQTPGKFPGRVVLKLKRGAPEDLYTIVDSDLHTVLTLTLEEALFGFSITFDHLKAEKVTARRVGVTQPDEVMRFKKKGLLGKDGTRGDLYVRLAVKLPEAPAGTTSLTLQAPAATESGESRLSREEGVQYISGDAWRLWAAHKNPLKSAKMDAGKNTEL